MLLFTSTIRGRRTFGLTLRQTFGRCRNLDFRHHVAQTQKKRRRNCKTTIKQTDAPDFCRHQNPKTLGHHIPLINCNCIDAAADGAVSQTQRKCRPSPNAPKYIIQCMLVRWDQTYRATKRRTHRPSLDLLIDRLLPAVLHPPATASLIS